MLPAHESVEAPEPVTLVGVSVQVSPVVGDTVAVKLTAPLNPWRAVTVIADVPAVPALAVTDVGFAAIVKSWTVYETDAECERLELVPVTATMYAPAEPIQARVAVPEPATLVGVRVQVRPVDGDTTVVRLTTPLKPCSAATVIVEVPETPARIVTEVGLAAMVKSCTVYVTVTE